MARRVSWTNNSSGHSGTYVYRAPTLDPQNLPAPVATVDPVAQGATAEWIDDSGEYGCFAVQDFDGQGEGALSAEVCVTDPWANVQIGDDIEGGIYAGAITYGDGRKYHIIFAKKDGLATGLSWGNYNVSVGASDNYDGVANQDSVLNNFDNGDSYAFYHCRDYVDSLSNNDYYLPARYEIRLIDSLVDMSHPEFDTYTSAPHWTSTEYTTTAARTWNPSSGEDFEIRSNTPVVTRPIRRIPA